MVPSGAGPRVDSSGERCCQDCGTRRSRCKGKLYKREPGFICHPCYDVKRRPAGAKAAAEPVVRLASSSRKRRALSDPGEPPLPRLRTEQPVITHRVTPPKPAPTHKKQRTTRSEEEISRLLDETVARRMVAQQQQ